MSNWYNDCENCLYQSLSGDTDPCNSCIAYDNWERKVSVSNADLNQMCIEQLEYEIRDIKSKNAGLVIGEVINKENHKLMWENISKMELTITQMKDTIHSLAMRIEELEE